MRIKSLMLLALSILMHQTHYAQIQLSLKDAKEMAVKNSYLVQDKVLEYEKAKKTIQETAAMGLPQISAKAEHNYNAQIPQTPVPASFITGNPADEGFVLLQFGVPHQSTYGLNASMLILDGSYFVALMASRVFKEMARNDISSSKNEVIELVTQNYGSVQVTEKLQAVLAENLKVLSKTLEENKALLKEGFFEEEDVDQLEILVNNVQINLNNIRKQAELSRMLLNMQLGLPVEQAIVLTDPLESLVDEIGTDIQMIQSPFRLEDHVNYKGLLLQERGAQLQLRNQQMSYLPSVSAFASHQQMTFGSDFEMFNFNQFWVPVTVIGVSVNWRLFTGMDRYAKTAKARIDLDRLQLAKEQTKDALTIEHITAKTEFEFALANYQNQKKNVESSQRITHRNLIKYREGMISSLELSQVENQLLNAQNDYAQSLFQLIAARARLEKSYGINY